MLNLFKGPIYLKNLLAPIYPETTDMVIASHSPFLFTGEGSLSSMFTHSHALCGECYLLTLGVLGTLCPCRSQLQTEVKSSSPLPWLTEMKRDRPKDRGFMASPHLHLCDVNE